ncbi:class I SAM-dependent methyltransferase [Legionella micdadei]|uniref:class I SAM-dependent methyltransferase n=1 Tax=Legionella micdadei TaxID=451 RepID=UPI0009EF71E2|nr:class I SAM-dependent methyltransferase [Legionella micdadei]ARG99818.1 hypothetical protein B6V88_04970 [Legionella micdadei]
MKGKCEKSGKNVFSKIEIDFFKKDAAYVEALEQYRKKLLNDGQAMLDDATAKFRIAAQAKTDDWSIRKLWPNSRSKLKVATLHALNSGETLRDEAKTNKLDILSELPPQPVIVDLGMGNGQFLIDLAAELKKKCVLIGVSASPNEVKKCVYSYAGIHIVKGKLPHDSSVIELLEKRQGTVDKVFDTYGPATYANNPLHCLIYAAILLKPGGKFSAMTSTENNTEMTVFGNAASREKIKCFFKSYLGIDINFEFNSIRSELSPGMIYTDLLVTFTKEGKALSAADYLKLCRAADREVGIARVIKPSWYGYNASSYGMFSIDMRTYKPFEKLEQKDNNDLNTPKTF